MNKAAHLLRVAHAHRLGFPQQRRRQRRVLALAPNRRPIPSLLLLHCGRRRIRHFSIPLLLLLLLLRRLLWLLRLLRLLARLEPLDNVDRLPREALRRGAARKA